MSGHRPGCSSWNEADSASDSASDGTNADEEDDEIQLIFPEMVKGEADGRRIEDELNISNSSIPSPPSPDSSNNRNEETPLDSIRHGSPLVNVRREPRLVNVRREPRLVNVRREPRLVNVRREPPAVNISRSLPLVDTGQSPALLRIGQRAPLVHIGQGIPLVNIGQSHRLAHNGQGPTLANIRQSPPLLNISQSPPLVHFGQGSPMANMNQPASLGRGPVRVRQQPVLPLVSRRQAPLWAHFSDSGGTQSSLISNSSFSDSGTHSSLISDSSFIDSTQSSVISNSSFSSVGTSTTLSIHRPREPTPRLDNSAISCSVTPLTNNSAVSCLEPPNTNNSKSRTRSLSLTPHSSRCVSESENEQDEEQQQGQQQQRQRKSARLQSPSKRKVECCKIPWHLTPELAVVQVFSCLNDLDRCNASLACSAWRRAFFAPCLWRRRHFVFRGFDALEQLESYHRFLAILGHYIQHATFELARPNINTASIISKAFEAFVSRLSKTQGVRLLTVQILGSDFHTAWRLFSHNRGLVVRALCSLLKKQSCLRSVDLSYLLMDREEGTRVLDSLSYGTRLHPKQFLAHLDLRQFFSPATRTVSLVRYGKVVTQFTALVSIRIDLRSLNENILERLAGACAKTIRRMELDFYADETLGSLAIGPECWSRVAKRCEALEVAVLIHGLCVYQKYTGVLARGMPLGELRVTYLGVENLTDNSLLQSVEKLIMYVAERFYRTLSKFQVQLLPDMELKSETPVVNLVARCLHLVDLCLNFSLQAQTFLKILEIIQKNRATKAAEERRTRLRLNVRGMTPELDRTIKQMTSSCGYCDLSGKPHLSVSDYFKPLGMV